MRKTVGNRAQFPIAFGHCTFGQNDPMPATKPEAYTWKISPFESLTLMELHDVLRLRMDIFVVEQNCAYPEIDGKDPMCHHCLGKNSHGALVAVARIAPAGVIYSEASIGRVVVDEAHRGKEIGRRLMQESMAYCREVLQAPSVKIAAQLYLEKFYQSLGFETISEVYPWDGIDHVDMRWTKAV